MRGRDCAAALLLLLATIMPAGTAQGGPVLAGRVTVLGVWGGDELRSFLAMVKPFEDHTGVHVDFEGTRDINAVLTTRAKGGHPPDVAGLPGPGQLTEFVQQRWIVPLDGVLDTRAIRRQYAPAWLDLATVGGRPYGIFVKAALKGLIWYNPRSLRALEPAPPRSWDALLSLTARIAAAGHAAWCIGLESGAATGWPATDWIETIMLRTAGPATYDRWVAHQLPWTAPEVKRAWTLFGTIASNSRYVYGGIDGVLAINFGESPFPLFTNPPGCYLHLQGSFIQDFIQRQYPSLRPIRDVDFFPFPPIDLPVPPAIEVAGDLFGMFRDTPAARALLRYLTGPEAQTIWVARGGALSPNRDVDLSRYPDPLSRKAAEILRGAEVVRFDGSDLMPAATSQAFLKATLDYLQHPRDLDTILERLDGASSGGRRR